MPKPGSNRPSRGANRRARCAGSRFGRLVPSLRRHRPPSTRWPVSSSRRAPRPAVSNSRHSAPSKRSSARAISSGATMGSAKTRRTRWAGAGRRGEIGSGSAPSAWARRRATPGPTRGASAAGGNSNSASRRRKPRRSRSSAAAGARRRAAGGSGASAAWTPPGGTTIQGRAVGRAAKRASAQAAPGVSASAARALTPRRIRRVTRSASRAVSAPGSASGPVLPKKWQQPVTSNSSPAAPPQSQRLPSTATQGV